MILGTLSLADLIYESTESRPLNDAQETRRLASQKDQNNDKYGHSVDIGENQKEPA